MAVPVGAPPAAVRTGVYGSDVIPMCAQARYLGFVFSKQQNTNAHADRARAKAAWQAVWLTRVRIKCGPEAALAAWSYCIRPILEYGAESLILRKTRSEGFEAVQRLAAKKALGCSAYINNATLFFDLGWMSLASRRTFLRVSWLVHVNGRAGDPIVCSGAV